MRRHRVLDRLCLQDPGPVPLCDGVATRKCHPRSPSTRLYGRAALPLFQTRGPSHHQPVRVSTRPEHHLSRRRGLSRFPAVVTAALPGAWAYSSHAHRPSARSQSIQQE